jgi:hypothetical protein
MGPMAYGFLTTYPQYWLKIWKFENFKFWIVEFLIFEFLNFWNFEFLNFWIFCSFELLEIVIAFLTLPTKYDNNPRPGVLVLAGFLILGTFLLWLVNVETAKLQAEKFSKNQIAESLEATSRQKEYAPIQSASLVG